MRVQKLINYLLGCIPFFVEFLIIATITTLIGYIVLVIDYNTNKKICKYLKKQVQKIK